MGWFNAGIKLVKAAVKGGSTVAKTGTKAAAKASGTTAKAATSAVRTARTTSRAGSVWTHKQEAQALIQRTKKPAIEVRSRKPLSAEDWASRASAIDELHEQARLVLMNERAKDFGLKILKTTKGAPKTTPKPKAKYEAPKTEINSPKAQHAAAVQEQIDNLKKYKPTESASVAYRTAWNSGIDQAISTDKEFGFGFAKFFEALKVKPPTI